MKQGSIRPKSLSSLNPYYLQFNYLKRSNKQEKRKHLASANEHSSNRSAGDQHSSFHSLLNQSLSLTAGRVAMKTLSLSVDKRSNLRRRDALTGREQQEQQNQLVSGNFPQRKQRGRQLHFFKMLRRYTQQSRLIEQAKSKIYLFSRQNEVFNGLRPRLKRRQMQAVPKQRYYFDTQQQKQSDQYACGLGKSLTSIKVSAVQRNT